MRRRDPVSGAAPRTELYLDVSLGRSRALAHATHLEEMLLEAAVDDGQTFSHRVAGAWLWRPTLCFCSGSAAQR